MLAFTYNTFLYEGNFSFKDFTLNSLSVLIFIFKYAYGSFDTACFLHMLLLLFSTKSCPTLCHPWTAVHDASLSFTVSRSLFKLTFIESVMLSNHLILCCPLLLLPSVLSQHQGLFQRVSSLHQVTKVL